MKMNFLFTGIFWGIVLIVLGGLLVLKYTFNWDIPVGRIILAVLLILIGLTIIFGKSAFTERKAHRSSNGTEESCIFGDTHFDSFNIKENYSVIFGKGILDLSQVPPSELPPRISVSTVFGETEIVLPASVPVKIKGDTVFGETRLPDGGSASFGSNSWQTPGEGVPAVTIVNDCIFGSSTFRSRNQ